MRVVVLGAGFGGLNTAATLVARLPKESGWTVTLVDRHNYFLFTPLLYHAATGLVEPSSVLFPIRGLTRAEHFRFREATVLDIDRGECFGMDRVGSAIWAIAAEPVTVGGIADQLTRDHDVSRDDCLSDILPFIEELVSEGLLRKVSE